MAKARVTSVGLQVDTANPADETLLRVTSVGLQADFYDNSMDDRTLLYVTSVGLQVEVGEWYPSPQPIRTRPRIPASRTIPLNPASRTGTEPAYGGGE